jgi:predicted nucleic acid-binding protein
VRRFLIDTNVIIDILSRDENWSEWSASTLEQCAEDGRIAINPIIYAEIAVGFDRIEDLEAALPEPDWLRLPLPWQAGFLAGRCFGEYRRRGGARNQPLPDFFIGAHAAVEGLVLVSRDASRFKTYFPRLDVLSP